jgi:hypothetical protein
MPSIMHERGAMDETFVFSKYFKILFRDGLFNYLHQPRHVIDFGPF